MLRKMTKRFADIALFFLVIFLTCGLIHAQSPVLYTTPGTYTWTVPPCVNQVTVEVWGGGGGGGAVWSRFDPTQNSQTSDEACTAAGGGGGGGFASRTYSVTPGQVYTIVVGAGGAGGVINNSLSTNRAQNGSSGGNSTFSGPATSGFGTLTGSGGSGGGAANYLRNCLGGCYGAVHQGNNGAGGNGGIGSNGTSNFTGGNGTAGVHSGSTNDRSGAGGGGAGSTSNGGNASSTNGGAGGNASGGNGANGIVQPYGSGYLGTNGNNGSTIGGGGGGACGHNRGGNNNSHRTNVGGNGARGEVRITFSTASSPTPTFNAVPAICSGDPLNPLPTSSNEGIVGTWSPSLNNSSTTTYIFTPDPSNCANTTSLTITVSQPSIVPSFTQIPAICSGETLNALPNVSNNGISGSWSPSLNNSATSTYTFSPNSGQCATTSTLTITVNQPVLPLFDPVGPYCTGATIDPLPNTSTNLYNGTWSPALNNTQTSTYTFTPSAGQCATTATLTVSVGPPIIPTFYPFATQCSEGATSPLPNVSNEGISGVWGPIFNPLQTTTYTFTPDPSVCAQTTTATIVINSPVTTSFQQVPPLCSGDPLPVLSSVSENGISGSWSPAPNNSSTTLYTFTPDPGQCATTATMTITVNTQPVLPIFDLLPELCQNSSAPTLPIQSNNGVVGSWNQPVSTAVVGLQEYIFTPDQGQCGTTASLTITIVAPVTPQFDPLQNACQFADAPILNTTSTNGIQGTWTGQILTDVSGIQDVTFLPEPEECAFSTTLSLEIYPLPVVIAGADLEVCQGQSVTLSGQGADIYTWSSGILNNESFIPVSTDMYTLTGTSSQGCTASDEVTVVVNPVPVVIAGADQTVCSGEQVVLIASGADNYVWSNGVSNNIPFLPLPGVNTYSVVGTNSFGCTAMDEVQVSVVILEQPNFQVIGSGCAPLEITLDSYSTSGNCDWQISNGESLSGCTVQTILSQPGCYDVTLTITQSGCTSSITALNAICADEVPSAFFVSDPLQGTTLDPTVQFVNLSQNATSYEWFFGDGSDTSNAFEPIHDFPSDESGSYEVMLVASSLNGCTDTAITIIVINEELVYYVPNAFTPDADSYNQVFLPVFTSGFDPLEYHLTIFNRWGEIVFESYDSEVGWAGDYGTIDPNFQCQDGVYTWKIEFKLLSDDSRKEIFGHVNLLR
jgi:hypothetical protein